MNVDKKNAALLVMDYQNAIVAMIGDQGPVLVERCKGLVDAARKAGVPVLWVTVGFRAGYPEINPTEGQVAYVTKTGRFGNGSEEVAIPAALGRKDDEPRFTKLRVGAFVGSGLDVVLRAQKKTTLILAGISTSGVVLSTVRDAADRDFQLVVVEDCCADGDAEVHRVLTQKVFPRQAQVVKSSEVIDALR